MIDVQKIIDLAQNAAAGHVLTSTSGKQYVCLPEGMQLSELPNPSLLPELVGEITGVNVPVATKDSFVEYFAEFAGDGARSFLSLSKAQVEGRLDYHDGSKGDRVSVRRDGHVVSLTLQHSEEWTRWSAADGKLLPQADFARFCEENAADFAAPAGADMLEIVRDLSAARKVDFRQAVRLDNGDLALEWSETTEAKTKSGTIEVPRMFRLRIPVFYGEPPAELNAFLRYRIEEGALRIGLELHRPVFLRQSILEQVGLEIRSRTGRPLYVCA